MDTGTKVLIKAEKVEGGSMQFAATVLDDSPTGYVLVQDVKGQKFLAHESNVTISA